MLLVYIKTQPYPLQFRRDCRVDMLLSSDEAPFGARAHVVNHLGELIAAFQLSEVVGWAKVPAEGE